MSCEHNLNTVGEAKIHRCKVEVQSLGQDSFFIRCQRVAVSTQLHQGINYEGVFTSMVVVYEMDRERRGELSCPNTKEIYTYSR